VLPGGRIVTTQKGEPLVKVWTPEGRLVRVLGRDVFHKDVKSLDVAADSRGRIYVADSYASCVRVFEAPK
jgi:hypothetical protein